MPDAPVITCDVPGSYARGVLERRHPALIDTVAGALPFGPDHRRALHELRDEITTGPVRPLPAAEPGRDAWARWGSGHFGRSWWELPFLWAENYFYRKLLAATGYFLPGPWRGVDPVAPLKDAELREQSLGDELAGLDSLPALDAAEADAVILEAALWGNRADLGFRLLKDDTDDGRAGLLADDRAAVWSYLDSTPPGTMALIADNAGRELLHDLVLVDHLLRTGRATGVDLHLKPSPYFVSDATTADLLACLDRLDAADGQARVVAARLRAALRDGRLALCTHDFYTSPLSYPDIPADLARRFAATTLTIVKGDLNYRRLVQDRHWPATTPFARLVAHFPAPLVALRTLKSDVAVGLDQDVLGTLPADGSWRTSGEWAVIQAHLPRRDEPT